MTLTPNFEQPDRPTATQTHGTHLRSGQESVPLVPPFDGRSQGFNTPFDGINDEITEWDERSLYQRILLVLSRLLTALLFALIGALIFVNWPT